MSREECVWHYRADIKWREGLNDMKLTSTTSRSGSIERRRRFFRAMMFLDFVVDVNSVRYLNCKW